MRVYWKLFSALMLICFLATTIIMPRSICAAEKTVFLAKDAEWKYNDNGIDLATSWVTGSFDDSSWKRGKAPLGYGDDFSETEPTLPIGTRVGFGTDPNAKYMTTYFRTNFEVSSLAGVSLLEVYLHVDDGAVVYANGHEIFRKGIEEGIEVRFSTPAKFKPKEEIFTIPASALKEGENVIAVRVHQDEADGSDLWFEMSIKTTSQSTNQDVKIPDPAAPKGTVSKVTVAFHGNTKDSKGFTWYTTAASGKSDLQVVEKTEPSPDFSRALKFIGRHQVSTNASPAQVVHKAEAINLKSNTTYYFRVGDETLNLWSETGTFRTAAKDGAFTFVNLSDPQAKSENEAKLSAETFTKAMNTIPNAAFLSINGDMVDVGLVESQWDNLFGYSKDILLNNTLVAVAGNHDESNDAFYQHINVQEAKGSATKTGAYFSFDYCNAHFVGLNTNEDSKEFSHFTPEQIEWMKSDIKVAKAAGQKWIIVMMHVGPYTTSDNAFDTDIQGPNGVRTLIAPMMEELGIDLVLQGHDHIYARTLPIHKGRVRKLQTIKEILNGKPVEYYPDSNGTIYVNPGTAGPKAYSKSQGLKPDYLSLFAKADEHPAAYYGADPEDSSKPLRGQVQNFFAITVNNDKLTVVTYQIDQNKFNAQPTIVDQFGIIKNINKPIIKGSIFNIFSWWIQR